MNIPDSYTMCFYGTKDYRRERVFTDMQDVALELRRYRDDVPAGVAVTAIVILPTYENGGSDGR